MSRPGVSTAVVRHHRVLFVQRFFREIKPTRPIHYLAIFGGLFAGFFLLLVLLVVSSPGWYRPLNPIHRQVRDNANHAQASFLALRNELQNPRLSRITWRITQDEINSLLAVTLENVQHGRQHNSATASLANPFIHFENNTIVFAIQDNRLPFRPLVTMAVSVRMMPIAADHEPRARVRIRSLHIGLLPMPRSFVMQKVAGLQPEVGQSLRQTLAVYAGAGYAKSAAPQIMNWLASILAGKPFPMEIQSKYRRLYIARISVRGTRTGQRGNTDPPELTIEFAAN